MNEIKSVVKGGGVVVKSALSACTIQLEPGQVYRVQEVEVIPKRTLLPPAYIDAGFIPESYARHLFNGIGTTNHDSMGSDRFFHIEGRTFSAAWFRPATAAEVNRHAKSIL